MITGTEGPAVPLASHSASQMIVLDVTATARPTTSNCRAVATSTDSHSLTLHSSGEGHQSRTRVTHGVTITQTGAPKKSRGCDCSVLTQARCQARWMQEDKASNVHSDTSHSCEPVRGEPCRSGCGVPDTQKHPPPPCQGFGCRVLRLSVHNRPDVVHPWMLGSDGARLHTNRAGRLSSQGLELLSLIRTRAPPR